LGKNRKLQIYIDRLKRRSRRLLGTSVRHHNNPKTRRVCIFTIGSAGGTAASKKNTVLCFSTFRLRFPDPKARAGRSEGSVEGGESFLKSVNLSWQVSIRLAFFSVSGFKPRGEFLSRTRLVDLFSSSPRDLDFWEPVFFNRAGIAFHPTATDGWVPPPHRRGDTPAFASR